MSPVEIRAGTALPFGLAMRSMTATLPCMTVRFAWLAIVGHAKTTVDSLGRHLRASNSLGDDPTPVPLDW